MVMKSLEKSRRVTKKGIREPFCRPISEISSFLQHSRPAQWATLDELLDKLIFLAVSGDGMYLNTSVAPLYVQSCV
jgi:hypothetical protein